MVLSKPFFDPAGFIVAEEGSKMVGFAHAGFAPAADWMDLDLSEGVISLILFDENYPRETRWEIGIKLVELAENYLIARGTKQIYVGSRFPEGPFYLGLIGGSQIPGMLPRQQGETLQLLLDNGYAEIQQIHILQRRLSGFQSVIDRQQIVIRRNFQIEAVLDPEIGTWWETCTLGDTDRTRFVLYNRKTKQAAGNVTYWDIQPLSRDWGVRTMGLFALRIEQDSRKSGFATFLVGESLRQLQQFGVGLVEAQVRSANTAAIRLFQKFGFEEVDHGVSLFKKVETPSQTGNNAPTGY